MSEAVLLESTDAKLDTLIQETIVLQKAFGVSDDRTDTSIGDLNARVDGLGADVKRIMSRLDGAEKGWRDAASAASAASAAARPSARGASRVREDGQSEGRARDS